MTIDELKYQIPIYRNGNIYFIDGDREVCAMESRERAYIRKSVRELCERVHPTSVLEFGFGFGFTTQEFQDKGVTRHVIIEPNDYIYQQALYWRESLPVEIQVNVEIVNCRYQDFETNEHFDLIYNDIAEFVNPEGEVDENGRWLSIFDFCKRKFNFNYYSEFCVDKPSSQIPIDYFAFDYYNWHKIQMLVPYGS